MVAILNQFLELVLEVAPWMVLGLLAAGLIKAWIPEASLLRWLGGQGWGSIVRGALIGAPLPLCSCSVVPVAIGLHRQGASKPAAIAFLVATPETGVDSLALSWVLLGPMLTVIRPVAAILGASFSGLMILLFDPTSGKVSSSAISQCGSSCCPSTRDQAKTESTSPDDFWKRTRTGLNYAMTDLWDDLAVWLLVGLIATAFLMVWIPPGEMSAYAGGGWMAMLTMVLVSVPINVCASASTPLAAAMLHAGLSQGMALTFMLAGPATNLATLAIIRKELGWRTLGVYLVGVVLSAMILGQLTDILVAEWYALGGAPIVLATEAEMALPNWLTWSCTFFLIGLTLRTLFNKVRAMSTVAQLLPAGDNVGSS